VVPAILRLALEQSRDSGLPFEQAWPAARLTALSAASGPFELADWRAALNDTQPAWAAAYEDQPASALAVAAAMVAA
jgi:hypothetical protein